jgi:hypothetical protein
MLERFKAANRVLQLEISAFVPNCGCTRMAPINRINHYQTTWQKAIKMIFQSERTMTRIESENGVPATKTDISSKIH